MKRPFALSGFSALLTLAAASFLGAAAAICLMAVSGVCTVLAFLLPAWKKNRTLQVLFITVTWMLLNFTCHWQFAYTPSLQLNGVSAKVTATVTDLPTRANGRYYYVLQTSEIDQENVPQNIKIRFSSKMELPVEPYDTIRTTMHFMLPNDDGGFSTRSSYRAKGIYLYAYAEDDLQIQKPDSRPVYWYFVKAREGLMTNLERLLPQEEASMVQGILLGVDDSIPADIRSDFRAAGISHLLAVSGMHTAVLVGLFLILFRKIMRMSKRVSALLCMGIVVGFMALTAFTPSVMRAGIMYLFYLLGLAIRRESDSLNSLGLAVLILVAVNPFAAMDIGLLLSFLATLGMILLAPRFGTWLYQRAARWIGTYRLVRGICMITGQTAAAMLFTLPVMVAVFGEVSLVSPIANLLCVTPSSVMMICGGLAAASYPIGLLHVVTYPLALAAGLIGKCIIAVTHGLAQLPFSTIPVSQPYVLLWLVGTLILIGIVLMMGRHRNMIRLTALVSVIVLCSGILSAQALEYGITRIAVVDTGNGVSLVISREDHAAVIGCGGSYHAASSVSYYLRDRGIRKLDVMILPMMTDAYASGASELLASCPADAVMLESEGPLAEGILREASGSRILNADSCEIQLWDDVTLTLVRQEEGCIILMECGETRVLFCSGNSDVQNTGFVLSDIQAAVLEGSLPVNYQELNVPVALIAGKREEAAKTQLQLLARETEGYAAADGTLELATKGDGVITVRRCS